MALEGFGSSSSFGFGQTIYRVTNLNTSGAGSLADAVSADNRFIIFQTSGTIEQDAHITISGDNLTIAGQTAPYPGIQLKDCNVWITGHDVLLQHIRIRTGDDIGENYDAMNIQPGAYNVVVDHCSIQWGIDECAGISESVDTHDITFSYCLVAEGLHDSIHTSGVHSMGMILASDLENISVIRCLLAHNNSRNPRLAADSTGEVINCITYNSGTNNIYISGGDAAPGDWSIRQNHTIQGLDGGDDELYHFTVIATTIDGTDIYYDEGIHDLLPASGLRDLDGNVDWLGSANIDSGATILEATGNIVYDHVLKYVGAWPVNRDSVDLRIIADVRNGTGNIIDSQDDVGGWPVYAVNSRVLSSIPATEQGQKDWLAFYSRVVEEGTANALFF